MSHTAAPVVDHHYTTTGIDSKKLALWSLIGSECLFFASLISMYLVYKGRSLVGPLPHSESRCMLHGQMQACEQIFEIPLVTFGTAVLLFSSFFVVMALYYTQKGQPGKQRIWLSLTVLGGLFFVGMQVYEFTHFFHKGLGYSTNLFGSTFYTLTGFHGTHVTVGVIWLGTLLVQAFRGKLTPEKAILLEIAALYWHFVDVVWIVIFPTVYLLR